MPKALTLILVGMLLMGSLFSCHKTGGAGNTQAPTDSTKYNPGLSANGCRIIVITDSLPGSTAVESYSFSYDSQGREDSMREGHPFQGSPVLETFQRMGNTLIMLTTSTTLNLIDTITLNGNGLMTRDVHAGGSTGVNTYSYSGTAVQQSIYQGPSSLLTTTYNWSTGDMVSWNSVLSGGSGDMVNFGYDTVRSSAGDYWHLGNMISYPAPWMVTAHRVTSVTEGSQTFTYVYTVDTAGKITSMTSYLGGAFQAKYGYTYDCP